MKLLVVILLVSSVVIQASAHFCPSGWTRIFSRCFLYVNKYRTWADAEKNCLSMRANLASVHTRNEYHQVQKLITAASPRTKIAWIGGSDAQQWGTWLWSDGSLLSYTNWCKWQPDNFFLSQHCLVMNYSGGKCWDDDNCIVRWPYVCAKKV